MRFLQPPPSLTLAVCVVGLSFGSIPAATPSSETVLAQAAVAYERQLREQILPYWYDTTLDQGDGGYWLADNGRTLTWPVDKQLVSQSRMIWGFSLAHRLELGDEQRDYLAAARLGYRFLHDHFRDPEHGGYYWTTDLAGVPLNRCKFLYGESFAVYALVEFYRASEDPAALADAMALFRVLQRQLHDAEHGGWLEHTTADWTPLPPGDPRNGVEVVGYKSANAHLHWMEALSELYDASQDAEVRVALEEALRINREMFYPFDAGQSCFHRQPDWSVVTDPSSAGLSYGHNVEFAWLMIRAEQLLGRSPSWDHFHAHLNHALRYGTDSVRGGLYSRGVGDTPASDTTKVWWGQAEMMAALADAQRHAPDPVTATALEQLVGFVNLYFVDPRDGIWIDSVAADGSPLVTAKAHNWKANYHDLRGIVKFLESVQ